MAQSRRVVITGLGAVSPIAVGATEFFDALSAGKVGIRRITAFDPGGFPAQIGGEIDDYSARDHVPKNYRKAVKVMARDIELAVGAADIAVRDAALATPGTSETPQVESSRVAVNIGAGLISAELDELSEAIRFGIEDDKFSLRRWGIEGMSHLTPLWLLKYLPNMLSCHVTIIHDGRGPANTITCAEASSLLSVGEGTRHIGRGDADVALTGGAESKMNMMGLLRQCLQKRLTLTHNDDPQSACRPFDADCDGSVIGEGGGVILLEEAGYAAARGATAYAEIAGFGATAAASGQNLMNVDPSGTGIAHAVRKALAEADMGPGDIDLIVPEGLSCPEMDAAEAAGLRAALGSRVEQVPTWPILAHVGNTGAGCGSLQLIAAAFAVARGQLPATVNCPNPRPELGLQIHSQPLTREFRSALVTGYAVAGQSAAIILRKV